MIKIKHLGKSKYTSNLCEFLEYEFKKQNIIEKLDFGLQNCKLENWGCFLSFNGKRKASTIALNFDERTMLKFERESEYIFEDNINNNSLFPIYKNVFMKIFDRGFYTDRNKNPYEIKITFFINNNLKNKHYENNFKQVQNIR
jgi:hypothetical protein